MDSFSSYHWKKTRLQTLVDNDKGTVYALSRRKHGFESRRGHHNQALSDSRCSFFLPCLIAYAGPHTCDGLRAISYTASGLRGRRGSHQRVRNSQRWRGKLMSPEKSSVDNCLAVSESNCLCLASTLFTFHALHRLPTKNWPIASSAVGGQSPSMGNCLVE